MSDLISRQAAIDAIRNSVFAGTPTQIDTKIDCIESVKEVPSAQPDVPDINVGNCPYCHEDSDGFVFPIEKNGHACIWHDIDGWAISLKAKGWRGSCHIKFCPMCGRGLKHG